MHRRHVNRITHLEDSQGNITREHSKIEEELLKYYQDLLMEPKKDRTESIQRVIGHIPSLVTLEKNAALTRPITQEEVDQAVKTMPPGKAPGPDGFTPDFFYHSWDLVRQEVWEVVEESRASGLVLPALKCHLSHPYSERRKSQKPQAIQTHRPVQRYLQNHNEGHSQSTQTHSAICHFQGADRVCGRETNHGQHHSSP